MPNTATVPAESFAELTSLGAATEITGADTLAAALDSWLRQPATLETAQARGREFLARQSDRMDQTLSTLLTHLPPPDRDAPHAPH